MVWIVCAPTERLGDFRDGGDGPLSAPLTDFAAVAAGGAIGASMRHAVNMVIASATVARLGVPAMTATLVVNVAGCAALGAGAAWLATRPDGWTAGRLDVWLMVRVGVLGSLTTFSTFIAEILMVGRDGSAGIAAAWLAAHLLLGTAAMVAAGWWVAS